MPNPYPEQWTYGCPAAYELRGHPGPDREAYAVEIFQQIVKAADTEVGDTVPGEQTLSDGAYTKLMETHFGWENWHITH